MNPMSPSQPPPQTQWHIGAYHQHQPQGGKPQHRGKFHALGEAAYDQRGRDDGEGHLEHEKHGLRDISAHAVPTDPVEEELAHADKLVHAAAIAERQPVASDQPQDGHQAGNGKTLHQYGQDVLAAHQARIEQASPGRVMNSTRAVDTGSRRCWRRSAQAYPVPAECGE